MKHAITRRRALVAPVLLGSLGALLGPRFPRELGTAALAASVSVPPSLFDDPASPIAGNPLGTVDVVEFFDYRCPYCRMMEPELNELIQQDKNVRLILKEWPIFGGISVYAAQVALASNWQGKYLQVHAALFAIPRTMDQAGIRDAAQRAGVDLKRLDHDLSQRSLDISTMLAQNDMEARALQLQGTPAFVIGNTLVPGALTMDQLQELVRKAKRG